MPASSWIDFIRDTAPEYRKPTIERLSSFIVPTWQALIDGARCCEPQLRQIIARNAPDVIVEDNVVCFPALVTARVPVRAHRLLQSAGDQRAGCRPRLLRAAGRGSLASGRPTAPRSRSRTGRCGRSSTPRSSSRAHRPCRSLEFMPRGNAANLYVYPQEVDYVDDRPLDATWHRMDSSVRQTDAAYQVPAQVADGPVGSALIYLSLGSLGGGGGDVDLMRRLVDVLGRSRHRFIVSKGPRADEYDLPANMVGEQFLPQTTIIPQVDAVITHGGNNTTTECLHFGKPMVLLPLFWTSTTMPSGWTRPATACGCRPTASPRSRCMPHSIGSCSRRCASGQPAPARPSGPEADWSVEPR
jgi:hypothetical protein